MAEHVSESQADGAGKGQTPSALGLAGRLAQVLREHAPPRYFTMEQYDAEGEIVEVWEGHPLEPGEDGVRAVIITGTDYAEPRTDWRERGIVPPQGYHPSLWRA